MEYIDIIDENDELTGEILERNDVTLKKLWHRIVLCWIVNENNEVLFQKRTSCKEFFPNMWGICAGGVISKECPKQSMIRELKEELGINQNKGKLELVEKYKYKPYNAYIYEYIFKTNMKVNEFILQKEEVSEVKYLSIEEIHNNIRNKELLQEYIKDIENIEKIEKILFK